MESAKSMVISVMDRDRPGIVAEVTEGISALGGNLAELSQTVVCGYFTMILVADFPSGVTTLQIEEALSHDVTTHVFVVEGEGLIPEAEGSEHVYVLSAVGRNRVGLVAQVSRFCCDHGVNILDLASHAEDDQYTMMLQIDLTNIENVERFEKELTAFAQKNRLTTALQHNDIFKATNEI